MEYMSLALAVRYGTPVLLFVLIVINVYQSTVIAQLRKEITDVKGSITWGDTCNERHVELNRRVGRLEKLANGSLKGVS